MKKLSYLSILITCMLILRAQAQDQTNTVFVPADQWTNSGISVSMDDRVCIWGFGLARFNDQLNRNLSYYGPGGTPSFNSSNPAGDAPTYALIAKIGSSGTEFGVGTYWEFTAQSSGDLYFSVNDQYLSDNEGFFTAIVAINDELQILPPMAVGSNNSSPRPNQFNLDQNYPNPFNPHTTISYNVHIPSHVNIKIYNSAGRLVRTLVEKYHIQGDYSCEWNGTDNKGYKLASGTYYYQLTVGEYESAKQMILLK